MDSFLEEAKGTWGMPTSQYLLNTCRLQGAMLATVPTPGEGDIVSVCSTY